MLRVTLLLVAVAVASALSDDWLPGCPYENLVCQNGGAVEASKCQRWLDCPLDPPNYPLWNNFVTCTCPPGWRGSACDIVDVAYSPTVCPKPKVIDGTFLNLNAGSKKVQCFMDSTGGQAIYSLRDHRVDIVLNVTADGTGSASALITSRHVNDTLPVTRPHFHQCETAQEDLRCLFTDCNAETLNGINDYTCKKLNCWSCGFDAKHTDCSPILAAFIKTFKPPVHFKFFSVDETQGTAIGQLATTTLTFQLHCMAGQCTDSPPDNNAKNAANTRWIVGTVVGSACAVVGALLLCVFFFNRKPVAKSLSESEQELTSLNQLLSQQDFDLPKFGIIFDHVTYQVRIRPALCGKPRKRQVLRGITGMVRPGEMVAILGSSGAGKSSLMDLLSARVKTGIVGGYIGIVCDSMRATTHDIVSYVLQDDHLLPTQTVRESLTFAAKLRLPAHYTDAMIDVKVWKLMRDLAIDHIADSRIGTPDGGGRISGGERKRVAIGCELIADPRFLLLDEPTSGLDSFSAHVVMKVLRATADAGCACMLSIHQPPANVFNMFDQILLVTRKGQQAFFGPPMTALHHMAQNGFMPPDKWTNPAEFLLEVASQESPKALSKLPHAYYSSEHYATLKRAMFTSLGCTQDGRLHIFPVPHSMADQPNGERKSESEGDAFQPRGHALNGASHGDYVSLANGADDVPMPAPSSINIVRDRNGSNSLDLPLYKKKRRGFLSAMWHLCMRNLRHISRDMSLLISQLGITILIAVITGLIYFQLDIEISGIQNRTGLLFFIILYFTLVSLSSIGVLHAERVLFLRERAAKYYDTLPYFISRLVCDILPMRVVPPFVFGMIMYRMCGLNNSDPGRFVTFLVVLVLINMVATSACFAFSAAVSSVGEANLIASLYFIFSTLFGGLLFSNRTGSTKATYFQYLSFVHYGYEALMCNEFQDLPLEFNPTGGGDIQINGNLWLLNFGMDPDNLPYDCVVLLSYFGLFVVMAFIFLRYSK